MKGIVSAILDAGDPTVRTSVREEPTALAPDTELARAKVRVYVAVGIMVLPVKTYALEEKIDHAVSAHSQGPAQLTERATASRDTGDLLVRTSVPEVSSILVPEWARVPLRASAPATQDGEAKDVKLNVPEEPRILATAKEPVPQRMGSVIVKMAIGEMRVNMRVPEAPQPPAPTTASACLRLASVLVLWVSMAQFANICVPEVPRPLVPTGAFVIEIAAYATACLATTAMRVKTNAQVAL